jgi:Tfp pilus assembly PilM family ATPase
VVDIPAGLPPLPDPAACRFIESTLRAWVRSDQRFRGRKAACVMSASQMQWHNLELPAGTEDEHRGMVMQEVAAEGPATQCDVWMPPAKNSGGSANQVVAVSVPRAVVDALVESLDRAGLECLAVDAPSHALARAVAMDKPAAAGPPVALLDWGATAAQLTLAVDHACVFTRILRDSSMTMLLEACAGSMGIDVRQVARLLGRFGYPAAADVAASHREVQNLLLEFSSAALNHVTDELRKTLSFLKLQWPAHAPARVWLAGFGGTIRNVAELLSQRCGMPFSRWRLPPALPQTEAIDGPEEEVLLANAAALSALAWES